MKKLETIAFIFIIWLILYTGASLFIPFSFFVDVSRLDAQDVCLGDNHVEYSSERKIAAPWSWLKIGVEGGTWGQVVKFEDQKVLETTIFRALPDGTQAGPNNLVSFGYEPNTDSATYNAAFTEPFNDPGIYGVNEWITIWPLPFVPIKKFNPAGDTMFAVIDCSYER